MHTRKQFGLHSTQRALCDDAVYVKNDILLQLQVKLINIREQLENQNLEYVLDINLDLVRTKSLL